MAKTKLTVELPALDDIRERMQQIIADELQSAVSGSDNTYFTLPGRQVPMTVNGVTGTFACSWFALKDAGKVEERRAATVGTAQADLLKRMTADERKAYAEQLLDSL